MLEHNLFKSETKPGEPTVVGATTITPIARRWRLSLPEWIPLRTEFALIFQQPTAVKVDTGDRIYQVSIIDYQLMILFFLLMVSAVCGVVTHRAGHKDKNK